MRDTPDGARCDADLTEVDYTRLTDFIYQRTGLHLDGSKRYFVQKRITRRMQACGQPTFRDYFNAMRTEVAQAELQELINEFTVNETYFFREGHQFDLLTEHVLPICTRDSGTRTIRIWCVPCSTGEEPYSVALHLIAFWPDIAWRNVEIMGSDIDTQVLSQARAGRFGERSLHLMPPALRGRYFTGLRDGSSEIADDLRQAISFTQVNLMETPAAFRAADIDVIFCRNLLIYFDKVGQRRAVENLFEALRPGGFVFLGHSESMARISGLFTVHRYEKGIVYQKPPEVR